MRELILFEHQPLREVALSPGERDALLRLAPPPKLLLSPSAGRDDYYDLTPGSWIGAISLETMEIIIRPKIPIDSVLFMLSYALRLASWSVSEIGFVKDPSLLETIIPGFAAQVRRALFRGVLQGYRAQEAALATVRGRIRFDEQVRTRFGLFPPVEVRYSEFTRDIEENRLLKSAIVRLGAMRIRSPITKTSLRSVSPLLEGVSSITYNPSLLPEIIFTRLNEHYRPAIQLAKLILRSTSFELQHGQVLGSAFLLDMNDVFESFVVLAVRDALEVSETVFPQGAKGRALRLDEAGSVKLLPDLSWWDGQDCCFVGDVKYKKVNVEGILHPDLYQLLAYTVATNLPGGLLVYAAGEGEPARHTVVNVGKELEVVTLDLRGSADDILRQIAKLAHHIRSHRQRAQGQRAECSKSG